LVKEKIYKVRATMFLDEVIIKVKAGKGGNGCISFRRERFVPRGGPDGGNGGRGGNIYIQADLDVKDLLEFYRNPHYQAENGASGSGGRKSGKNGCDLYLRVPVGTIIEDITKKNILADLTHPGEKICVAQGGIGGKGNYHYRTSTLQSPRFAQKGELGQEKVIKLNLKLISDAALIGFPNVGKSTILSRITNAKPKIADYPFTTVEPNLGVVKVNEEYTFTIADIPGLIEDAHKGAGLGISFLKHIERTKVLVHVIDGTRTYSEDVLRDYHLIKNELKRYSLSLQNKKEIIVVNKCDLPEVKDKKEQIKKSFLREGIVVLFISALTGNGLPELIYQIDEVLNKVKSQEAQEFFSTPKKITHYQYKPDFVIKKEGNRFIIDGEKITKLVYHYDLDNPQALKYFQEKLKKLGVEKALRKKGISEGDIVRIGKKDFYFFA